LVFSQLRKVFPTGRSPQMSMKHQQNPMAQQVLRRMQFSLRIAKLKRNAALSNALSHRCISHWL
jgi:hypothetical protein